jgi:gas vesicle protein
MGTGEDMDRQTNGRLVVWLLAGIALGGVGALLLAPETGARTRKKLLEGAGEGRKSLLESGQELFAKGRELFEQGREVAEEVAAMLEKSRAIAEKNIEDRL